MTLMGKFGKFIDSFEKKNPNCHLSFSIFPSFSADVKELASDEHVFFFWRKSKSSFHPPHFSLVSSPTLLDVDNGFFSNLATFFPICAEKKPS